jgi:hypothetical protein
MRRLTFILLACLIACATFAAPGRARVTMTYCQAKPYGGPSLLVRATTCHEGRAIVHKIFGRRRQFAHFPLTVHLDEWACRVGRLQAQDATHPVRCQGPGSGLIWSDLPDRHR